MYEYLLYVKIQDREKFLGTYTESKYAWDDVTDYYEDLYPESNFIVQEVTKRA